MNQGLKASESAVKRISMSRQLDGNFQRHYSALDAVPACRCPGTPPDIPPGETR